jgi:sec-independent protein translocase protein TatA
MPFGLGPLELAIILLIVLMVFGPKRLPGLGRQLGTGMREFKEAITGKGSAAQEHEDAKPAPAAIAAAPEKPSEAEERSPTPTDP